MSDKVVVERGDGITATWEDGEWTCSDPLLRDMLEMQTEAVEREIQYCPDMTITIVIEAAAREFMKVRERPEPTIRKPGVVY